MRTIELITLLHLALGSSAPLADPVQLEECVRFEKIGQISVVELSRLVSPEVIFSESNPVISFWVVDTDYDLMEGDWRLIGIAVGSFSGLHESPVAAKVWVKPDIELLLGESREISSKGDEAIAIFGLPAFSCSQKTLTVCEQSRTTFVVNPDREVFAGGIRLGAVKFE